MWYSSKKKEERDEGIKNIERNNDWKFPQFRNVQVY